MRNPTRWSGCRITEVKLNRQRVLFLENEILRVGINMDKGAEVFEFRHKPSDVDAMWHRDAAAQAIIPHQTAPNGLDAFFDHYTGGWQESFPVGNATGIFHGAQMYLHGEVSLLPWQSRILEDSPERIEIEVVVECVRSPFLLKRRMSMERNLAALRLDEIVTNTGRQALPFAWGHHVAFGSPLLGPETRLDLPEGIVRTLSDSADVPRRFQRQQQSSGARLRSMDGQYVDISHVPLPESGTMDNFEIELHGAGSVAIRNPSLDLGVGLLWNREVLPFLWEWEVCHAAAGYPLWGRDYLLALEPFNCPIGGLTDLELRLPRLEPGGIQRSMLTMGWCPGRVGFTPNPSESGTSMSLAATAPWLRRE